MKHKKNKFSSIASVLRKSFTITVVTMFITTLSIAQSNNGTYEIFSEKLPTGAVLQNSENYIREIGSNDPKKITNYLYVASDKSPAEISGLSIRIRENPGPGEYRYITFKWIKWGDDLQIGMHFNHDASKASKNRKGEKYNYSYGIGKNDLYKNALIIDKDGPGRWTATTRDLWKDFGDFTLTGVSLICPSQRDAGFDGIFLGKTDDAFVDAPKVGVVEVAKGINVEGDDMTLSPDEEVASDEVTINVDWAQQIKAGGVWMYPLYFMGIIAIVIAIQRAISGSSRNLAPKKLRRTVRESLAAGNIDAAIEACDKYPSTLSKSLSFILTYRNSGREVVTQSAGDIAARDIREHLNRSYPLSVIASLAPLLGLLGTIVGMIEAFYLVALYGDEGGAAILSDSISKALITTAAGLIIAAPSVAVYFMLKKRIMGLASVIEVEIENAIAELYLKEEAKKNDN